MDLYIGIDLMRLLQGGDGPPKQRGPTRQRRGCLCQRPGPDPPSQGDATLEATFDDFDSVRALSSRLETIN